ncbi:MAG: bifunctional diaminohydroxyphosphoribosylaminopyrimidine deaminase/5-amino-6-(5-phosphoribosylamino)uracil reductase RibD [Prochloraceae cyanobacterium]
MNDNKFDRQMMLRCIELASRAKGKTSPNPMVGSVIVVDGKIVGEGFHPAAGKPHAEVYALKQAGNLAKNATVYVNLEPCNHYGRTPPCTEALIAAKVTKVVVGTIDPDPRVSGQGIERLKNAGITVIVGVEAEACRRLNEAFIHRVKYKTPFGIFKYAMTLDGKIAATTGDSAWVTGIESRRWVHRLRSHCDAIIVGGNTVRQDNPNLTTHGVSDRNPLRIVMSRSLNLPLDRNLWDTSVAPTLVFTEPNNNSDLKSAISDRGVEIIALDSLSPKQVMEHLYDRGLSSVLWECGGVLAANAIADRTVQKLYAFIAPKIIGGNMGYSPIADFGLTKMNDALKLDRVNIQKIDSDFLIEGYLVPTQK